NVSQSAIKGAPPGTFIGIGNVGNLIGGISSSFASAGLDCAILLSLCLHSPGHYSTFVSGCVPRSVSETVSRQVRDKDGNPRSSHNRREQDSWQLRRDGLPKPPIDQLRPDLRTR